MPSIRAAAAEARRVALRFPLVLLAGIAAAVVGSVMVRAGRPIRFEAALVAATLGLPLFVALRAFSERGRSRPAAIALAAAGVLGLLALGLVWSHWSEAIRTRRYVQFSIGLHLLAAFLPYARGGESNGFWQYNRTLFLRFLTSALYSAVLFVGLAIALVALDRLFKVRVHPNAYLRLWLWIAFVFNTWFFLGGFPADFGALDRRRDYPRALKVFSQFILIPLVAVYLTILTAYLVRIVVTGQWPSGWIGYLVSSVAAVGILSLLLVHPVRDDEGHRWVGAYARWFYVALLPAVGMLLAAIWKRIDQYGVTEDRYFIAVLALWLTVTAVVFIARPRTGIRWIPITLCLLAFGTTFGPHGAYAVSRRSQMARLRQELAQQGMLAGGVVTKARSPVAFERRKQLSSTVYYLLDVHGERAVREVLGNAMPALRGDSAAIAERRYNRSTSDAMDVMAALGVEYANVWDRPEFVALNYSPWGDPPRAFAVSDLDYHVHLPGGLPVTFEVAGHSWQLRHAGGSLELSSGPDTTIRMSLDQLVAFARAHGVRRETGEVPPLTGEAAGIRATVIASTFNGSYNADTLQVGSFSGDLYLKFPRP